MPPGSVDCYPVRVLDAGGHSDGGPGRYVLSQNELSHGSVVLRAKAFHVAVLDSHRKRICAKCFALSKRRLEKYCRGCSVPYYCSDKCRVGDLAAHSVVCPVHAQLKSIKVGTALASSLQQTTALRLGCLRCTQT